MAYTYEQILRSQYENIATEQAQQLAELEAGRLAEDAYRTTAAADRILELDKSREALDRRAQGYVASQQAQPQGNAYGLSNDEIEVAKNSHSAGTADERIEEYAKNKALYRHKRATGEYRDDQGTVRR